MLLSRFLLIISLIGFLVACGNDVAGGGVEGTGNGSNNNDFVIAGFAQKGPFLKGSNVVIQPWLANATNSGGSINTKIGNKLGDFTANIETRGPVFIQVTGKTFNEINGKVTDDITLNAVINLQDANPIFINILTHMINDRVALLMKEGVEIDSAITQAETELKREIRNMMSIDSEGIDTPFHKMSLYNYEQTREQSNAFLLQVSASIYQTASNISNGDDALIDDNLVAILTLLTADFEDDGLWNSLEQPLVDDLSEGAKTVDMQQVIANLEVFSSGAGVIITTPSIENYLGEVTLSSIANDATLTQDVEVRADVPNGVGEQRYFFLVDSEIVHSDTTTEYTYTWQPYFWSQQSRHRLLIRIEDGNGRSISSDPVDVTISSQVNDVLRATAGHNTTIQNTNTITLSWAPVQGAESYCLSINDSMPQCGIETTSYTTANRDNLLLGLNTWKINATNAQDKTGIWSQDFSFSVIVPDTPTELTTTVTSNTVTFSWQAVSGAAYYTHRYVALSDFEDSGTSAFETHGTTSITTNPSIDIDIPLGQYVWQVRATNSLDHQSRWSVAETLNQGLFNWLITSESSPISNQVSVRDFHIDNNTYLISGQLTDTNNDQKAFVAKLDVNGNILWKKTLEAGYSAPYISQHEDKYIISSSSGNFNGNTESDCLQRHKIILDGTGKTISQIDSYSNWNSTQQACDTSNSARLFTKNGTVFSLKPPRYKKNQTTTTTVTEYDIGQNTSRTYTFTAPVHTKSEVAESVSETETVTIIDMHATAEKLFVVSKLKYHAYSEWFDGYESFTEISSHIYNKSQSQWNLSKSLQHHLIENPINTHDNSNLVFNCSYANSSVGFDEHMWSIDLSFYNDNLEIIKTVSIGTGDYYTTNIACTENGIIAYDTYTNNFKAFAPETGEIINSIDKLIIDTNSYPNFCSDDFSKSFYTYSRSIPTLIKHAPNGDYIKTITKTINLTFDD